METSVGVKSFGVSLHQLGDVHLENGFEIVANEMGGNCEIPRHITEFFGKVVSVEVMSLENMLLNEIGAFARFSTQAENSVYDTGDSRVPSFRGSEGFGLILIDCHFVSPPVPHIFRDTK
jgi:hypothetical protein